MAESRDEQLVVVSQVLVADINIGYEDIVNTQVLAFNGTPVKNLKNLATMVESCDDEYLKFDLEYNQVCLTPRCPHICMCIFCIFLLVVELQTFICRWLPYRQKQPKRNFRYPSDALHTFNHV